MEFCTWAVVRPSLTEYIMEPQVVRLYNKLNGDAVVTEQAHCEVQLETTCTIIYIKYKSELNKILVHKIQRPRNCVI
jgi:hypothetical protein